MVRLEEKPSLREASCCSVEVVKGGAALRLRWLLVTSRTTQVAARADSAAASAAPRSPRTNFCFSPTG